MTNHSALIPLSIALALSLSTDTSLAQGGITYRALCQNAGSTSLEALGDRDGHSISVIQQLCRIEGGPMDGGVLTGTIIYEWNKAEGTGLSGQAVIRKAGAMVVLQMGEFKNTIFTTDGKATGFAGSGQGAYKLATGSAAALAGKSFSYTGKPVVPGQYAIDFQVD